MRITAAPSEVAQMLMSTTSKRGLNRDVRAALLRVRTGPECPEGSLRELMWDSNPNHGIAREEKKKKKKESVRERTFPNSSLRHCPVLTEQRTKEVTEES